MSIEVREAAEEAIRAAEKTRSASDRIVSVCYDPNGPIALSESGQMYQRRNDPNHYNDGRISQKFRWMKLEGPFD